MYNYNSYTPTISTGYNTGSLVWTIISVILAIVGGFLVYFLFLNKDYKTDNKFLKMLRDFLNFKSLLLESILKITYIIMALLITLTSFNLIGSSFVGFLLTIILGNIVLRILYEWSLMFIMIWKNTNDMVKKLK